MRAGEERGLLRVVDLADELDVGMLADQRLDLGVVVRLVGVINLGGDLQRHSRLCRDADGAVDAFLGRDASQERRIVLLDGLRRQQPGRHAVVNRANPVQVRDRTALAVGDRDERGLREGAIGFSELRQVEAPVQGGQERHLLAAEQRQGEVVDVGMDDVELVLAAVDQLDQAIVGRHPIRDRGIKPQRLVPHRRERGGGDGVATGEQGHIVSHRDEFLGQRVDNALGPAVELGGDGFKQRRYLRNTHV